jgi:hypothetical protein
VLPERFLLMANTQNRTVISDDKIDRLQTREKALLAESEKLRARAEHLERVRHSYSSQLRRRQDTHEKVVLGALAKLAGLDVYRHESPQNNDAAAMPPKKVLESVADTYDRELILGGLLWLAQSMKLTAGDMVPIPSLLALQDLGSRRLGVAKH